MKRYDFFCSYDGGGPADEQESPRGEFVRFSDVEAALAQAQSCVPAVKYVPVDSKLRDGNWNHPNDTEHRTDACKKALNARGDDEGQGLDGYWKWGFAAGFNAALAASPQPQPVQPSETQWQKRHPLRTEGKWENTNEHDAKWWRDHSQGWEIRVLYAHPVAQAKPEQAARPRRASADFDLPAPNDNIEPKD